MGECIPTALFNGKKNEGMENIYFILFRPTFKQFEYSLLDKELKVQGGLAKDQYTFFKEQRMLLVTMVIMERMVTIEKIFTKVKMVIIKKMLIIK